MLKNFALKPVLPASVFVQESPNFWRLLSALSYRETEFVLHFDAKKHAFKSITTALTTFCVLSKSNAATVGSDYSEPSAVSVGGCRQT